MTRSAYYCSRKGLRTVSHTANIQNQELATVDTGNVRDLNCIPVSYCIHKKSVKITLKVRDSLKLMDCFCWLLNERLSISFFGGVLN